MKPSLRRLSLLAISILVVLSLWIQPVKARRFHPSISIVADPAVQVLLDLVEQDTLYQYVAGLSGAKALTIGGTSFTLATRSTSATLSITKATQYAYEHFQALGLSVSYQSWSTFGYSGRNVVAEQAGSNPNCIYLLTAHLDSTSQQPAVLAPGADDNASGSAGVLATADILSHKRFACTLRYVLFSGEEQGLLGSEAYAKNAYLSGDPIQGVLNLDMIAYNTTGSAATVEMDIRGGVNESSDRVLAETVSGVIQAYQLGLTPSIYASGDEGSDQASFWSYGFPAVEVIEDWDDHTPYYHTSGDQVDTLNLPYFCAYVKANLGALAHLAQLRPDAQYRAFLPIAIH